MDLGHLKTIQIKIKDKPFKNYGFCLTDQIHCVSSTKASWSQTDGWWVPKTVYYYYTFRETPTVMAAALGGGKGRVKTVLDDPG